MLSLPCSSSFHVPLSLPLQWLLELRYRRCCRVALAVRLRFMSGMATLFERYRLVEAARTELVAAALERLGAATARCFDRVSTRSVGDALRPLNTHADFFRVVGEDTRARIAALHDAKAAAERASAAAHAAHHHVQAAGKGAALVAPASASASASTSPASASGGAGASGAAALTAASVSVSPRDAVANTWLYGNSIGPRPASASTASAGEAGAPASEASAGAGAESAAGGAGTGTAPRSRRGSGAAAGSAAADDAGSSGSGASGGGSAVRRRSQPLVSAFHFELEPLPLVMTPLSSPLVVRVGRIMRQVGMLKHWRPFVGVLTRDGFLYLLQTDSDAGSGTSGSSAASSSSSSSSSVAAGDDLATHPDVLHAVLKWSAERLSVSTHGAPVQHHAAAAATAGAASVTSPGFATTAAPASGAAASLSVGPSAALADLDSGIAGAPPLPAPALPPQLMAMAAAYAGNVSDLLLAEEGEEEAEADGRRRTRGGASSSSSSSGGGSKGAAAGVSSALLERARKADRAPGTVFPITASVKLAFAPAVHADAFEISDRSGFLGMTNKLLLRATTPDDAVDWVVALNKAQELVALGTGAAATGGEP